ncbi:Tn7 transposase TnsA N-terminal domain-containing protein [Rhizobacter fulvus]
MQVITPDGVRPSRDPARVPGRLSFRAKHWSLCNDRHLKCESLLELSVFQALETLPSIRSFTEQPPRLRIKVEGARRASGYTPDVYVEWFECVPWLIEVKPLELAMLPVWQKKFEAIGVAALAHGYHFVVVTERHFPRDGMPDIRLAAEAGRRHYVESLGSPRTVVSLVDEYEHVRLRVLGALAEALRESPTYRSLLKMGVADAAQWTPLTRLRNAQGRRFVGHRLSNRFVRGEA